MAANKTKTAEERRVHLDLVASLYGEGVTYREIAKQTNRSVSAIGSDMKAIHAEWREARVDSIEQQRRQELAKIDWLEEQATEAWFKSQEDKKRKHIQTKPVKNVTGEGKIIEEQKVTRQDVTSDTTAGDPKFLEIIDRCIERRCRILGLDAPIKLEGANGGPIAILSAGTIVQNITAIFGRYAAPDLQAHDGPGEGGNIEVDRVLEMGTEAGLLEDSPERLRVQEARYEDLEQAGRDTAVSPGPEADGG